MSEKNEVWATRIKEQRSSGLTQKAWCEREGISRNTLQWWIKRLGSQTKQPAPDLKSAFAKVVETATPDNEETAPASLRSGSVIITRISLSGDMSSEAIIDIFKGLDAQ